MKVLHVLNEIRPSGAETMLRSAGSLWRQRGTVQHVLSNGTRAGAYAPALAEVGYTIHHIPIERPAAFFYRYAQLLRRERYDVVHVHTEHANFWLAAFARLWGRARVMRTIHSVFSFTGALAAERRVQRGILRKLGVTHISIGASVAETERTAFSNPTVLIENWYDSARFAPPTTEQRAAARARWSLASGDVAVVSVGNCGEVKNHGAILRALPSVRAEGRIVYLHAGQEGACDERDLAASLGLAEQVRFLGFVDDVVSLLHAADIYVMPSRHEGFGIAAVEALAAGVPAVLSDVPGLRDLRALVEGITWSGTDAASVAAGIQHLVDLGHDERRALGRRLAAAVAERLSIERAAGAYVGVWKCAVTVERPSTD